MAASTAPVSSCFVPVNVNDEIERQLFYDQRVICSWKFSVVDKMFQEVRDGERMMYWVCIPATKDLYISDNGSAALEDDDEVQRRIEANNCVRIPLLPAESRYRESSVSDEAGRQPSVKRTETAEPRVIKTQETTGLLPVGHISIDTRDFDTVTTPLLGASDGRILSITTLFILPYHRKLGLARWSMQECERRIRSGIDFVIPSDTNGGAHAHHYEPTEKIALSCLAERHHIPDGPYGREFWKRQGMDFCVRSNGQPTRYLGGWYGSLGYKRVHEMEKFTEINKAGEVFRWWAEIWQKDLM